MAIRAKRKKLGGKSKQEVKLKPYDYSDGKGVEISPDFPVFLRAMRLLEGSGNVEKISGAEYKGLVGWTFQVDCYTYGVKVYVRIDRKGVLTLLVEDKTDDKPMKVRRWTKGSNNGQTRQKRRKQGRSR